ncbi:MAG: hypothetical protein JWR52_939 [Marmoricola sp.]|nr:hypothetical protein [Marmoricola sp.]
MRTAVAQGAVNSVLQAKAGQTVTVPLTIAKAQADRQLTNVQLALVAPTALSADNNLAQPLSSENELATASVKSPGSGVAVTAQMQLPSSLAPGTYSLVAVSYWPMPSICGQTNSTNSTLPDGASTEVIGQLKVG